MSAPAAAATAMTNETRTVVVLGVSYGGYHAARMIASGLPKGWRVIAVDRNSHVNHLYVFPRFAVLGGHEHKAFIPYTHVFAPKQPDQDQEQPTLDSESAEQCRHLFLQARATALTPHSLTLDRAFPEHGFPTGTIAFDYLVYALGAQLPDPINLWAEGNKAFGGADGKRAGGVDLNVLVPGSKASGIAWLKRHQEVVKDAPSVLVVGGGALGIQYATDIAELYPNKHVTLMHSRHRLMPRFDEEMHEEVLQSLQSLGVDVILGSRLDLSSLEASATTKRNERGQRVVQTADGREVAADLVLLCTGQKPNTNLLAKMDARTVDAKTGLARVLRTMQLAMVGDGVSPHDNSGEAEPADGRDTARMVTAVPAAATVAEDGGEEKRSTAVDRLNKLTAPCNDTCYPHIFAIGDAADAFGALKAGHTAYFQGHIAAANLLKLIKQGKGKEEEEEEEAASAQEQEHEQEQQEHEQMDAPTEQLEQYQPGPPGIKVSLGLNKAVYQVNGVVGVKSDCKDDLEAGYMWKIYGFAEATEEEMLSL